MEDRRTMCTRLLFALFLIVPVSAAVGQQTAGTSMTSLALNITFPAHNDTFALEKVRVAGATDPAASVWISDKPVRVYPHGAFVSRVSLQAGMNQIIIRAEKDGQAANDVLYLFRPPEWESNPDTPTAIDNRLLQPAEDFWLLPGDYLQVKFKGSPNGTATFSVDKQRKNVPMTELDSTMAYGLRGVYNGVLKMNPAEANRAYRITVELRGVDGKRVKAELPGKLYILEDAVPLVGMTRDETNIWNAPSGGSPMGFLQDSIRLQIVGKLPSRYKIRLSNSQFAYVNAADVTVLPLGTPLPVTAVSSPSIVLQKEWYDLSMSVETPVPYLVQQSIDPPGLDLYLYGAVQGSQWTTYPNGSTAIKRILWSQPEENVLKIHVDLEQKQQWGYRVSYEGKQLNWYIRRAPKISAAPDSPVKGLNFALDAGHGGEEPGAVSPTGIQEKNVNLTYAKYLADMLRQAGANVTLTREDDTTMTLRQRVEKARQSEAHLFLWLHNNSVGSASDAALTRGTSTYFTIPQNQDLAWTVYPHLVSLGLSPFGRVFSSYYVTRATDMLVVLVEGAFMSNPEDEQLLGSNEFLRKLAGAVFTGVEDFLAKQR